MQPTGPSESWLALWCATGVRDAILAAIGFGLYWLYTGAGAIGFNCAMSVMKLSMVAAQPGNRGIGGHFD